MNQPTRSPPKPVGLTASAANNVPELRHDLPTLRPGEIVRVLDALERRDLVEWSGGRSWLYLGEIPKQYESEWLAAGRRPIPPEDVVRFWPTPRRR